jgi:hypothetical protein
MSVLWMPEKARAELAMEYSSRAEAKRVQDFTDRLEAFDQRLRCILATRDSPDGEVRNGFYYIARANEDGTTATWQVQNPDGSFREPDERDIEALRMLDLRNPRAAAALKARQTMARKQKERDKARAREETRDKIIDLADYRFRTQTPITKDVA